MYQALVRNVLELPVEICETSQVGASKSVCEVCVSFFIGVCVVSDPDLRATRLPAGLRLENRKSLFYALVDRKFKLRSNAGSVGCTESLMRQNSVRISQVEEWSCVSINEVPAVAADL